MLDDPVRPAAENHAEELGEYLTCLDAAVRHVREADGIETVVLCAHASGAIIAALWCHARRASQPADALVLVSPALRGGSWLAQTVGRRLTVPSRRSPSLLAVARRRVRRGLDISCPVLVLCPPADWDAPAGLGGRLALPGSGARATIRLGAHVTWLRLDGAQPGQALPGGAARRLVLDELARWLSAYLSSQIRDQLL